MDREIKIRDLSFSYNGKDEILKNINFDIFSGEFIGIVGRSGSGKSTLLKFLNGLLKSDIGNVEILGRKINRDSKNLKEIRKNIGIVFQFSEDQFFENSILEDIMFAPKVFKMEEIAIERVRKYKKNTSFKSGDFRKEFFSVKWRRKKESSYWWNSDIFS